MSSILDSYTPPPWSARPNNEYYLEVLKNGILVDKSMINQKAMYLVGKHGEICDIILENPTISRQHAVFQSKNTEEMYVYDLGSTHGTFVNNHKIPSRLFHKLGIQDQIKFGQSSRVYILRCTKLEEEDSQKQEQQVQLRDQRRQSKLETRSLKDQYLQLLVKDPQYSYMKPKPRPKQNEIEDQGISWGMIDEEEIYRYQQEQDYPLEPDVLKKLIGLSENQLEKIKKYDEKLSRFRVVQDELDELLNKERLNFGLEEILKRKKEKLQNKQVDYGSELDQADENLRYHIFGDRSQQHQAAQTKKQEDSSEDDEYYDNTLANKKKKVKIQDQLIPVPIVAPTNLENTTQTYHELKKKLEELLKSREKIEDQLLNLRNQNDEASKKLKSEEEDDALDAFMLKTVSTLLEETRPKLLSQMKDLSLEIRVVENRLRTVKPDIGAITDIFDEKALHEKNLEKKQQELNTYNQQSIGSTLSRLKELSKKKEKEDEEDEDTIMARANKHFEKEKQKDLEAEKQLLLEQKRKERKALICKFVSLFKEQFEEDDNEQQKPKKVYSTITQPHSRHYNAAEVENEEEFVDLVQFQ